MEAGKSEEKAAPRQPHLLAAVLHRHRDLGPESPLTPQVTPVPSEGQEARKRGPLFVLYVNKRENGRENGLPKGAVMADPTSVLRHTQSTQRTVHTEEKRGASRGSYAGPPPESCGTTASTGRGGRGCGLAVNTEPLTQL